MISYALDLASMCRCCCAIVRCTALLGLLILGGGAGAFWMVLYQNILQCAMRPAAAQYFAEPFMSRLHALLLTY
jgi:hypothetical protein